jgi:hypothetical protein
MCNIVTYALGDEMLRIVEEGFESYVTNVKSFYCDSIGDA